MLFFSDRYCASIIFSQLRVSSSYDLFSRLYTYTYKPINNTFLRLTEEFTGKDLFSERFSNSFASSSSIIADCSLKLG